MAPRITDACAVGTGTPDLRRAAGVLGNLTNVYRAGNIDAVTWAEVQHTHDPNERGYRPRITSHPRVPGAALLLSVVDPVAGAFSDVAIGRGYTDVPFEMLGRATDRSRPRIADALEATGDTWSWRGPRQLSPSLPQSWP
jgi:hypothetical protein